MKKILLILFCMLYLSIPWCTAEWNTDLNDGLQTWYNFSSDSLLVDIYNYNDNGTIVNDPEFVTGKIGQGLLFNSSDEDYVEFLNAIEINQSLTNRTISIWAKFSESGASTTLGTMFSSGFDGTTLPIQFGRFDGTPQTWGTYNGSNWYQMSYTTFNANTWYHIVMRYNDTAISLWKDGVQIDQVTFGGVIPTSTYPMRMAVFTDQTSPTDLKTWFNGTLDEMGWWNKSLSDAEIALLYNSGNGMSYDPTAVDAIVTTLISPIDAYRTNNISILFNATVNPANNITNATLYIWHSNGSIFNQTTNILTGETVNSTYWNVTNFTSDNYHWNVLGCGINDSNNAVCAWADDNNTFSWVTFEVLTENYTANVYETSNQSFVMNISIDPSILSVSANLIYNGTSYQGNVNCYTDTCYIKRDIDIPLITTNINENKTFNWQVTVFDGSAATDFNLTTYQQNVSRIFLEICNSTYSTVTLNFSAADEQNRTRINPYTFNAAFEYWLGTGSIRRNNSFSNSTNNETNLCIKPNDYDYYIDAQIEYDETNTTGLYTPRDYHFQNNLINNVTQHIILYLLKSASATSFILEVQDKNLKELADHLIYIQKYYPGIDKYYTVQVAKTNDKGKTVGFFEIETVDYRFIISINGTTKLITSKEKVVPEDSPYTLNFKIGAATDEPWNELNDLSNLLYTISFNQTNNVSSFTYIDSSQSFVLARHIVYKRVFNSSDEVICNTTSSYSSSTLTCDLNAYTGTFYSQGYIDRGDGEVLVASTSFSIISGKNIYDFTGLLVGWLIILTMTLAFIWNPTAMIVSHNIATIFVSIIGFIAFSPVYIFSMIGVSILLIVLLKT